MRPIYEVTVKADEFTKAASTAFDYKFEGTSKFEGWEKPIIPAEFSIGLDILGELWYLLVMELSNDIQRAG